jgi:hypothetical protein
MWVMDVGQAPTIARVADRMKSYLSKEIIKDSYRAMYGQLTSVMPAEAGIQRRLGGSDYPGYRRSPV